MKAEKQHLVLQAGIIQPKHEESKYSFVDNRTQTVSQTKLVQSIQRKENKTGLPNDLKIGIENLSGYSMGDVRVHYNSDKPAQHTVTQLSTNTTKKNEGGESCIQLLSMQPDALKFDFKKEGRRNNYFSTSNITFFNDHGMNLGCINTKSGKLVGRKKSGEIETQDINFLPNPLVQTIPLEEVVHRRNMLQELVGKHRDGYPSLKYTRKVGEDKFTPTSQVQSLVEYGEVMFVMDKGNIHVAPNGSHDFKLSHPSLLGGYPYEVDDAGILTMRGNRVIAIENSGHYRESEGGVNKGMTDMLNPPEREQLLNPPERKQHSSSSSECCYITTSTVNYMGLDDDCEELTLLRKFRDGYLINQPNGEDLIKLYYRYAPQIVEGIDKRDNKADVYISLYEIVKQCAIAIRNGDNEFAFNTYCRMVRKLYDEFIDETEDCVLETVI